MSTVVVPLLSGCQAGPLSPFCLWVTCSCGRGHLRDIRHHRNLQKQVVPFDDYCLASARSFLNKLMRLSALSCYPQELGTCFCVNLEAIYRAACSLSLRGQVTRRSIPQRFLRLILSQSTRHLPHITPAFRGLQTASKLPLPLHRLQGDSLPVCSVCSCPHARAGQGLQCWAYGALHL